MLFFLSLFAFSAGSWLDGWCVGAVLKIAGIVKLLLFLPLFLFTDIKLLWKLFRREHQRSLQLLKCFLLDRLGFGQLLHEFHLKLFETAYFFFLELFLSFGFVALVDVLLLVIIHFLLHIFFNILFPLLFLFSNIDLSSFILHIPLIIVSMYFLLALQLHNLHSFYSPLLLPKDFSLLFPDDPQLLSSVGGCWLQGFGLLSCFVLDCCLFLLM